MSEREKLEQAIAALEAQRAVLGDAAVDTSIAALKEKLVALEEPAHAAPQRKQITVLFADVHGFTAMSETMDAEDVSDTMNALWARVDKAIIAHGGTIDKHIGDAVMALFGAPLAREDDPERAIRTGLAMQAELAAFREEKGVDLGMRIGVNTGPVLVGEVGTTFEYTAIGDTVNLAARLEQAAPVGSILISHDTFRHVRGIFAMQALAPIKVKGKAEPVQVYEVQGIKPRAFLVPTRGVEGIDIRMIGRDAELKHLQRTLLTVLEEGQARIVTVVGEAGIGKSRLLHEFENWVELQPEQVLHFKARASLQTSSIPYFLFRELLSSRFEIKSSDRPEDARDTLEQGVLRFMGADAQVQAHFIGHLIGLDFSSSPHLQGILDDARQIHDRAFHYFAQFFARAASLQVVPSRAVEVEERRPRDGGTTPLPWPSVTEKAIPPSDRVLPTSRSRVADASSPASFQQEGVSEREAQSEEARRRPVALLLDDLHWADTGSLDLIEHLARECRQLPVLIVALARPEFFEQRAAWMEALPHHSRLDLQPLPEVDRHLLVQEILRKVEQVPRHLRDLIVNGAEGNPFYTEELIKMLIDDGAIVKGDEQWRVELERLAEVRVPPTLTGVLQARLDGLPPLERETLQRASVVGRVFWDGAVEQLGDAVGAEQNRTDEALASLRRRELVFDRQMSTFAEETEYLFKHSVLHDVTYESVLRRQRRAYHAQVAAWLAAQSGERGAEYAGLIGEHYERAEEGTQAATWYTQAGRQAQDTYAPETAINYYRKALELLPDGAEVSHRIELYQRLGLMLSWQTEFEEAMEAYAAMRTAAEETGDLVAQARAWQGTSSIQQSQGDYRAALESAGRAEEVAQKAGPPGSEALAVALYSKGWIMGNLGEAEEALSLGKQSLALSGDLGDRRLRAQSFWLLGWVHHTLGRYEQATQYFEQALDLALALGDRMLVGRVYTTLGMIAAESGQDYEEAAGMFHEALSIVQDIGHRFGEIVILSNLGGVWVDMGQYQAAETDLKRVIEIAEAVGWGDLSATYDFLAQAYLGQGKVDEALEAARQALALGQETELPEIIGTAWRALGMVLADPRAPESVFVQEEKVGARACFANSLRLFCQAEMEAHQAQTLQAWAEYEIERGDRERGEEMKQEAEGICKRLGITA
jgi:class 3 adenylate cyclase/tetratricopeptide (TPR) repeat protein